MFFNSIPLSLSKSWDLKIAAELFEKLGEDGRSSYVNLICIFDVLLPLSYGPLLYYTLQLSHITRYRHMIPIWPMAPFFATMFDLSENVAIYMLLNSYPDFSSAHRFARKVGPSATKIKWICLGYVAAVLILVQLLKRVRRDFAKEE